VKTNVRANVILQHFMSSELWRAYWHRAAVVVTGSSARGTGDEFSDTDILALVPSESYKALYDSHRHAAQCGLIAVMNPDAFQYREFPLILVPGLKGHYKVHTFDEVECLISRYEDVTMWIHRDSLILHDPTGRYHEIQKSASSYPDSVWRDRVRTHYLAAWMGASAAGNPLRRRDRAAVVLTLADCFTQVLRLCCLLEGLPFPYEKWLYREALRTNVGRALEPLLREFLEELLRPEIRRIPPESYERPKHRNVDLEDYPLFRIWRRIKGVLDSRLPT